jgi:AraC-like DNA-binding protein
MLTQKAGHGGRTREAPPEIIYREQIWYDGPEARQAPQITASRWSGLAHDQREHESSVAPDCHVLGIALRPMEDVTVYAARKLITSGHLPQGSMRVNEPGLPMRGIFRGAYDVLHLHIPNSIVAEYAAMESAQGRTAPLVTDHPVVDPIVEQLARSFIHAEELGGAFGRSYADGISLAITAQLFGASSDRPVESGSRVSSLSKWRLKRATEYMMANLAEPICLADIAAATGLSRMHFAAQFRAATGLRPHEYLIRRRIELAQELLLTSRHSLVEIALDVGFRTQAHFTTVFGRFVGETPSVWRQRNQMTAGSDANECAVREVAQHGRFRGGFVQDQRGSAAREQV